MRWQGSKENTIKNLINFTIYQRRWNSHMTIIKKTKKVLPLRLYSKDCMCQEAYQQWCHITFFLHHDWH